MALERVGRIVNDRLSEKTSVDVHQDCAEGKGKNEDVSKLLLVMRV